MAAMVAIYDASLYNLIMEVAGALGGAMRGAAERAGAQSPPPHPLLLLRRGLAESPGWFLVQAAEFEPQPLTLADLRVRDIYASERIVRALLDLMASERFLESGVPGAYHLTETGRAALRQSRQRQHALLATLEPALGDEGSRLVELLGQLIRASLESGPPPGPWCLTHSRRRAPEPRATPLAHLAQYCDDMNAFRDDAHMAAWQPLGISGHAWEAFALCCQGDAASADGVYEILAYRGYVRDEYAVALDQAAQHGWLEAGSAADTYAVTAAGRALRADVERRTDHYFFGPWSGLTEQEIATTPDLLRRVRDLLNATAR